MARCSPTWIGVYHHVRSASGGDGMNTGRIALARTRVFRTNRARSRAASRA
jgi:hypothetical protein